MEIKIKTYLHSENGISVQIIPETDAEEEVIRGIFTHGAMETGHPGDEKGRTGFYLTWAQNKA